MLDRLGARRGRGAGQSSADRLTQWFGWTDAISLSAALDGGVADGARSGTAATTSANAAQAECERVRTALASAIREDRALAAETSADYSPFRRYHAARRRAMEESIARLRDRLRSTLAQRSPGMARLAAVDSVMEQVLGAREQDLLGSTVPAALEKHFKHLSQAAQAEGTSVAWLKAFRQDFQDVLLAELDFRMKPVEGLVEALRTSASKSPP